ncbi:hypothetical protein C8F04DRAFT_1188837 [Mycena alexandri]|uniref:Uncharacterized protein n=1 Tax=Mycena alexandri TaxID=1745969 RepID=A0AAD6SID0_9AGAR|nr:hypothetical protein C8F04DRAFT_1188837 [Mycena alexandri]
MVPAACALRSPRLSLCLFPPSAGSAAYFMKGKRWRGVKRRGNASTYIPLSEGAHKRLDKEQVQERAGCSPVSIFAVDADDDVGMGKRTEGDGAGGGKAEDEDGNSGGNDGC